MDITKTAASLAIEDEGMTVEIDDENGKPAWFGGTLVGADPVTGEEEWDGRERVTITQAGMNSKRYRKVELWQQREFKKLGTSKQTEEQALAMRTEFLARLAIRWAGWNDEGSVDATPCTLENVIRAYTGLPFVQRKMEQSLGDRERFFGTASAS